MSKFEDLITEEGTCTVCGHPLCAHIDEGEGWRCHCIGADTYQCECYLRKAKADGVISWYDLHLRMKEAKLEMRGQGWEL